MFVNAKFRKSHSSVSALEVGISLDMLCTGLSCASVCSVSVCFHACRGVIALYRFNIHVPFFSKGQYLKSHIFRLDMYSMHVCRAVHLQRCFTEDLDHESIMEVG